MICASFSALFTVNWKRDSGKVTLLSRRDCVCDRQIDVIHHSEKLGPLCYLLLDSPDEVKHTTCLYA